MKRINFYSQSNQIFNDIYAYCTTEADVVEVKFQLSNSLDFDGLTKEVKPFVIKQATRAKKLWEKTCFELFIKNPGSDEYFEVNFSPLTKEWNAFYFSSYRSKLVETKKIEFIQASFSTSQVSLKLRIPEKEFRFHPKIVLYRALGEKTLFLSDSLHPHDGPDFHLLSMS